MPKQIVIVRRSYNVVKLDEHIWYEIDRYLTSRYYNISITIERDEGTEIVDKMSYAYDIMCDHSDEIKNINIIARNEDEKFELMFKTKKDKAKHSMSFKATCNDRAGAYEVRIFSDKLLSMVQASTNMIRLSSIVFFYTVFYLAMILLRMNVMSKWIVYFMILVSAVGGLMIDIYVYNPLLENLLYTKQRVQFWVDKEHIEKYKHINRRGMLIGWVLFSVAILIMLLLTFNLDR